MGTRINETETGLLNFLGLFLLIVLLAIVTGCSGTLEKTASICLAEGRDFEYSKAGGIDGFEKASCSGSTRPTTTVKVAR